MIIKSEEKKRDYLEKVLSKKHSITYRIQSNGLLEYDWQYVSHTFLAYIDGKWYGAKKDRTGSTEGALNGVEKRKFLFAITEDRYWARLDNNDVEYASPSKPLSESAVTYVVVRQKKQLCVFLIDGTKYKAPLMQAFHAEYDSEEILIRSIIALTSQHNPEAAKQMEDFWYSEEENWVSDFINDPPGRNVTCGHIGFEISKEDLENNPPWD